MNTTHAPIAIEAHAVARSYGSVHALAGVDLMVHSGGIVAILGPNGAGKTTLIEVLEGLRHRDAGSVSVLGTDPASGGAEWRARIGAVLQTEEQSDELTVGETMRSFASYYPRPNDVARLAARLGLSDLLDRRAGRLSGGQRRRLDLALGVIGQPEVLFLDEPTTGLDPEIRRSIWQLVRSLADQGTTVVLTTHYLEEVEHLADSVVVMMNGRVVITGTADEIRNQSSTTKVTFRLGNPASASNLPLSLPGKRLGQNNGAISFETLNPTAFVRSLMTWAGDNETVTIVEISGSTLEDAYVQLIGTEDNS